MSSDMWPEQLTDLPISDRTRETERLYQLARRDGTLRSLLDEPSRALLAPSWHLKDNRFPYDERWEVSDLLVFNRYALWSEVPAIEILQLFSLLPFLLEVYDVVRINGTSTQSVKNVPHVQLLRGKK